MTARRLTTTGALGCTGSATPSARGARSRMCRSPWRAARFAVLLGLNGAGKTTLFALVTRLYANQRGRIHIFGYDVARASGGAAHSRRRVPEPHARSRPLGHAEPALPRGAARHRQARGARSAPKQALARIALARPRPRQGAQSLRRPDAARRDRPRAVAPPTLAAARRAHRRPRHRRAPISSATCVN